MLLGNEHQYFQLQPNNEQMGGNICVANVKNTEK